jgi:hypothetical protein
VQLCRQIRQITPRTDINPRLRHSQYQLTATVPKVVLDDDEVIAVATEFFDQVETRDTEFYFAVGDFFDNIGRSMQQHFDTGQRRYGSGISAWIGSYDAQPAAFEKLQRAIV